MLLQMARPFISFINKSVQYLNSRLILDEGGNRANPGTSAVATVLEIKENTAKSRLRGRGEIYMYI